MQPKAMAEWIAVLFDHIISKYGGETTLNEFRVMQEITRCSLYDRTTTLTEIVEATCLNKSTVSRSVSKLVNRGFIYETIDPDDRRRRQIYLKQQFNEQVLTHFEKLRKAIPEES